MGDSFSGRARIPGCGPVSVQIVGAQKFRQELQAAEKAMADLTAPHTAAAQAVKKAAGPTTPRLTGALAASVRASGSAAYGVISSGLKYAPVIHWGWRGHGIEPQPWLSRAAQVSEPTWVRGFLTYANKVLGTVKGARGL